MANDVNQYASARRGAADRIRPEAEGPADYDRMSAAFASAAAFRPAELVVRHYRIAGEPVRIRCAGMALAAAVDAPLAHLRSEQPCAPALCIDLWDETATGVGCESCIPGPDANATGTVLLYGRGLFVVHQSAQTRTVVARAERRIVGWVAGHEQLTQYELGRPLHSDLLLWLRGRGIQAAHAGLVAIEGEGVLFGGPGGSGKTTTALTCLRAGMQYLADDYVGLQPGDGRQWVGHSLYASTHLEPQHLHRFPDLVAHARPRRLAREDKHLVLLEPLYRGQFPASAMIRLVALPRLAGTRQTSVRPASRIDVLRQLAPSSLFQLPYGAAGKRSFESIVSLVEGVPGVWLDLGTELEEIPKAVASLLGRELPT